MNKKSLIIGSAVALAIAMQGQTQSSLEYSSPEFKSIFSSSKTQEEASTQKLTAESAFVNAPLEIFPTIDRTTRLDMIDYYNSGSDKPSKNAFKGNARVLSLSESQIVLTTSDIQEVALSLVPHKNDTIIMMITTLQTPAEDSDVKFYSRNWQPVNDGLFIVPQLSDWIRPEAVKHKEDLENLFPVTLARCVYEPSTGVLTVENKLGDFLPEEDTAWANGMLHAKLEYRWNGKKMERVK